MRLKIVERLAGINFYLEQLVQHGVWAFVLFLQLGNIPLHKHVHQTDSEVEQGFPPRRPYYHPIISSKFESDKPIRENLRKN